MTHNYTVAGMTCKNCEAKVRDLLLKIKDVQQVDISLEKGQAAITMNKHISTPELQAALKDYRKYQLSEIPAIRHEMSMEEPESGRSWFNTYKPILLIFGYILTVTLSLELISGEFNSMRWMSHFMGAFFLSFPFFKLLDLNGFADSYSTYDIIAKRWRGWGYLYAFLELLLGLAFLLNLSPLGTNLVTFFVLSISIIGVLQSVLKKRAIKCACLGAVFNLPMSTVTIIEDALMIGMSAWMIFQIL